MENPRIGIYVCWCGSNIAKMVDVEAVAEEIAKLPNVVISKNYKYMCSDPGQDLIIKDIKEHNLNRVVVAACSPRIHEPTFRKALVNAGLNPYMFEMANIREHVSWVHTDRTEATMKARDLVSGALRRVAFHEGLDKRAVEINPSSLVVGGGIAGLSAAIEIADSGRDVHLVEREGHLGGMMAQLDTTYQSYESARELINEKIKRVLNHDHIHVYLSSEIQDVFGYVGNFEAKIKTSEKEVDIKFGNVIVATGLKTFDPSVITQYGYGTLPNVVTSVEFEQMLKTGKLQTKDGKEPKNIAIIHCVGSRNEDYHEYCSRNCCMTALKFANQVRGALPESHIYQLYADMRAFGKCGEDLYRQASESGVLFMMFDQKKGMPHVKAAGQEMLININDLLSGEELEVAADLVVLMIAVEAQPDAKIMSHLVGISMCGNAFFMEKHPKLDPVATTTDGVYIVGGCQGPKDIPESVSQARAAAARVLGTICQGQIDVEVTTACVNEDICCGCQTCIQVCPYTAISFKEAEKVSYVNEVLCKGCGTCGSACPSGAIRSRHFTDEQILNQIEGIMEIGRSA
ncbi:MAG: CoB--CoM heterodisulfide reductase iron-sulfur subunit A family protein [bacterium]